MNERILVDPVAGTRITVLMNEGLSFEQIRTDYYPDLTNDDIQACVDY